MDTEFWGPSIWKTIHVTCFNYAKEQKHKMLLFLNTLAQLLPCNICTQSFKDIYAIFDPEPYMENSYTLFYWSVFIHNLVNLKLQKPYYSFRSALQDYEPFRAKCSSFEIKDQCRVILREKITEPSQLETIAEVDTRISLKYNDHIVKILEDRHRKRWRFADESSSRARLILPITLSDFKHHFLK
ncbi:putative Evr1/Alr family thiol oxidoreductase [Namao virus]|nr:putative Evr1/Alr family thiol oxidoreductase [Namao virus]